MRQKKKVVEEAMKYAIGDLISDGEIMGLVAGGLRDGAFSGAAGG
jgi:hypothetical protein